jgi:hypothetical protein
MSLTVSSTVKKKLPLLPVEILEHLFKSCSTKSLNLLSLQSKFFYKLTCNLKVIKITPDNVVAIIRRLEKTNNIFLDIVRKKKNNLSNFCRLFNQLESFWLILYILIMHRTHTF